MNTKDDNKTFASRLKSQTPNMKIAMKRNVPTKKRKKKKANNEQHRKPGVIRLSPKTTNCLNSLQFLCDNWMMWSLLAFGWSQLYHIIPLLNIIFTILRRVRCKCAFNETTMLYDSAVIRAGRKNWISWKWMSFYDHHYQTQKPKSVPNGWPQIIL